MDLAILATFGAIAAGNYLAWSNINYKKFFNLFRLASSGQEAVKPAEIKIDKDKEDNSVILECTGIPIVDLVTPEQLAEVEQQIAEATSEKSAEKKAEKQQIEEAKAQPKAQLYDIKINTKKTAEKITLAEIYLSNWEENFEIIVTTHEGKSVSPEEYEKVVKTLKTLLPSTSPSKEIIHDPLISAVEADGGTIAFDNGKDLQFLEHNREFNRALLRSVVEKAKNGDHSFLNNYFEALEQGNRNSLFNAEKKHLELLEKKKKLEKAQSDVEPKVVKRWTIAIISAIAAVLVVAGVITAAVFFPPIIAAIPTLVPIISFIGDVINALIDPIAAMAPVPTAVAVAGTITTTLGFGKKLWRYLNGYNEKAEIKEGLEEVEKELEEAKEVENVLRKGVNKTMEKEGIEEVFKIIDPNIQKKADVLKLSDIGSAGLQVLFDHLQSNEIPRYQKIDLSETHVDEEGKKIILEALSQNYTVTELIGITVTNDIAQQLLINGYLQGTVFDNDPQITKLFGNAKFFKNAVITKIMEKNTYEKITSFAEVLEGLNPTEGVAKRLRELCKLSYTSTSATPEFKENLRKAALVSRVVSAFGNLTYNYKVTYEELRNEFKKQSAILKQSKNTVDAKKLDEILNKDFEEDLTTRYPSVLQKRSKKAVVMGTGDQDQRIIKKLEEELKSNYSLCSSDFVDNEANPLAKAAVEFICHRNLLTNALVGSNLEGFIENYSLIPAERCEEALEEIDKLGILKFITEQDFKDNNYSQVWTEVTLSSSCGEWLRKLDSEHREKLLEHSFSLKETAVAAKEKARVVSALLKIDGLFSEPDDDTKKDIKRQIYWAITPLGGRGFSRVGQPYYNLEELRNNLREKAPEGNSYREILDGILTPTKTAQTLGVEPVESVHLTVSAT